MNIKTTQLSLMENVEYVLRDKDGKIKQLFNDNKFCQALMKFGILNPLWINRWYAFLISPFLGSFADMKVVANGVTNVGFALAAGRLQGSGAPAAPDYVAVGTGVGAFSAADTTLGTESAASGLSRAQGTVSLVTTTQTNDTAQCLKTFTVTGTVAVTESGLLNASSNGTLLCRQTFSAINVVNGDSLQITWKVKCA